MEEKQSEKPKLEVIYTYPIYPAFDKIEDTVEDVIQEIVRTFEEGRRPVKIIVPLCGAHCLELIMFEMETCGGGSSYIEHHVKQRLPDQYYVRIGLYGSSDNIRGLKDSGVEAIIQKVKQGKQPKTKRRK